MADRFYEFPGDNKKYVSVTTFLSIINKPFLMPWAAKMERELIKVLADQGNNLQGILEYLAPKRPYAYKLYTEDKAEIGSKVHKAIDYKLKGLKLPRMTKQEKMLYAKWLEWWKSKKYILEGAERTVKSLSYGYAGTMDALVTDTSKGVPHIIDWKTGKNHYPEHELQNLAYQHCLTEEGFAVGGGELVYITADKEILTKQVAVLSAERLSPVVHALGLWRWANNKPWKG